MSTSELPVGEIASTGPPTEDEVLGALRLLLESPQICQSNQLRKFLDFIVRETLAGRQDGLKEYALGCEVFGRRETYDPRQDGIVRVQATSLRKRIKEYYRKGGADDRVVIELPRGGYVPCFRYSTDGRGSELGPEGDGPDRPLAVKASAHWRKDLPGRLLAFALGSVAAGLILLALARFHDVRDLSVNPVSTATSADLPQLWGPFLERGARNLIAFGVPLFFSNGGLYVRDIRVNALGKESDEIVRELARKSLIIRSSVDDLYTGVGELESVYLVSHFFRASGVATKLASVRTVGRGELPGQNLVVLSSLRFQTILQDLNLPTDFEWPLTKPSYVRNLRPFKGEKAQYAVYDGAGVNTGYAIVSLWPGVDRGRRILHIGGISTWATGAATEFLLDRRQLRMLAREFEKDRLTGSRGVVSPYFQILLRTEERPGQLPKVAYVTHHYLSAAAGPTAGALATKP